MNIEINDDWLKRVLNASPDQDVKDALKYQLQRGIDQKYFAVYLGEYVIQEMIKQL